MDQEEEFDPTLSSPAMNAARVYHHVIEKGFQMGGVVGCAIVAPIVLYRHRSKAAESVPALAQAMFRTVLATTAASGVLCTARLASIASEDFKGGVEDRAYRLHYNRGQNRVDRFSHIGTALGGAAALLFLPASAVAVVAGGAAGSAAGVLAHVVTMPRQE